MGVFGGIFKKSTIKIVMISVLTQYLVFISISQSSYNSLFIASRTIAVFHRSALVKFN